MPILALVYYEADNGHGTLGTHMGILTPPLFWLLAMKSYIQLKSTSMHIMEIGFKNSNYKAKNTSIHPCLEKPDLVIQDSVRSCVSNFANSWGEVSCGTWPSMSSMCTELFSPPRFRCM